MGDDGGDRGEITRLQAFSVDGIACCTSLSALAPSLPGFSALAVGALVKKRERVDCCLLVSAFAFDIVRLVMLALFRGSAPAFCLSVAAEDPLD